MMWHETWNTYEAAWLMMNGASFERIKFMKNNAGSLSYMVVLSHVEHKFLKFWEQGRPIGNIRTFANCRLQLKKRIHEYQKEIDEMSKGRLQE